MRQRTSCRGGGRLLSSCKAFFEGCKSLKICYNNDMLHHIYNGVCMRKNLGFTLAEVLITLGIIGVVAAMTMPSLIANHNKRVVETRLKKFYSSINQAIKMAELDYGERDVWYEDNSEHDLQLAWLKKYIVPYMNVIKVDEIKIGSYRYNVIYFADGSALSPSYANTRDWLFYPGNPERCLNLPGSYAPHWRGVGICSFAFFYHPVPTATYAGSNYNKSFNPFHYAWNGTEESLKNNTDYGCYNSSNWHAYCTRLIQYNNWKIPDDYPYRVFYR